MADRTFMPLADENWITITRGEFSIRLTPAEAEKATRLIGIVLGMETMKTIPDHVKNSPFIVRFFEDNNLALERLDLKGSIPFNWDEADDLITTINDGLNIAINERTLIKGARGVGVVDSAGSEPFV